MDFFTGFGVDEHLGAFLEVMSLDKDQKMYMKWLEDMHKATPV